MINLNKIKMTVIETAENGVVNEDTIFDFTQKDNYVEANYFGGKIKNGFLVGLIKENIFEFSYCQLQTDGILDNGISCSELVISSEGKIRLIEHFEWKSRPGEYGVNIFEEV
ncbi:hypothetical protein [Mariniflexile sp. HMF6888]|uniref:hypothetical protein n=1 Tax=Mariniflexile sp. HMF6888 TaxID=3373086 RepID=UPI0037AD495B